jgi:hypothetical protein
MPTSAALVSAGTARSCADVARRLGLEPVVVYESATPTMVDRLVLMAHGSKFSAVVVDRLATLAERPLDALRVAAWLHAIGMNVISASPDEAWLPAALTAISPALSWMDAETKRARVAAIHQAVLRSSRRPGRPKQEIERCGVGASTLRRWCRARAEEQRLAALAAPSLEAA